MINAPEQHIVPVIPDPELFAAWASASILQLGKRPSHFLLEKDKPGSKNRASYFLKQPGNMKLWMAQELQRQILTDAVRTGINLQPIEIKPLADLFRQV